MSKQQQFQRLLYILSIASLLLSFLPLLEGAPLVPRDPTDTSTVTLPFTNYNVSVQSIVLTVILFITGGYLCFLGGVHQHFTMFIVGFYVGSNVAYIILLNAKEDYGSNTETILLVVSVVVGILAGLLLSCCFFLAVYLVGALLGYFAALWLLSWVTNGLIQSNWGRAILIIVFVIVGVILMAFFERILMVIATAFIGSFAIFIGVDIYVKTGFAESVINFLRARSVTLIAQATPQLRGMLGGCLGLAIVGALIQFCQLRRRSNPPPTWNQQYPYGRYGWKRV
ncbi:uncharacterized protein BX664DRAFT_322183 [Halteromyces radiatus]|uniref:uncharacterized protein n=1 Tax=Halteromyces radiatus TaxID=101107 RepID=UPI002220C069|nr:uncharacterized protein BX664DRAFT_322183 [Halteromyces radiatus]KAI8099812.1 hypothetical protein BX664DRAFT_322183 [Halteromyces radiatus]